MYVKKIMVVLSVFTVFSSTHAAAPFSRTAHALYGLLAAGPMVAAAVGEWWVYEGNARAVAAGNGPENTRPFTPAEREQLLAAAREVYDPADEPVWVRDETVALFASNAQLQNGALAAYNLIVVDRPNWQDHKSVMRTVALLGHEDEHLRLHDQRTLEWALAAGALFLHGACALFNRRCLSRFMHARASTLAGRMKQDGVRVAQGAGIAALTVGQVLIAPLSRRQELRADRAVCRAYTPVLCDALIDELMTAREEWVLSHPSFATRVRALMKERNRCWPLPGDL